MDSLIEKIKQEAIDHFGSDKIGTRELRLALPNSEKEKILSFLVTKYYEHTSQRHQSGQRIYWQFF